MSKKEDKEQEARGIIRIPHGNDEVLEVTVRGTVPLIVNAFPQKAKQELKDRDANAPKKPHAKRDPEAEYQAALYRVPGEGDESYGLMAKGFKAGMVQIAKDLPGKEINGAFIMRQIFVEPDVGDLVRMKTKSGWTRREDMVRVNGKTPMVRYRPEFEDWEVKLRISYNADVLDAQGVINLLVMAGRRIGYGELRPEKGGTYGRYEVVGEGTVHKAA
jgi:hypothetical protein